MGRPPKGAAVKSASERQAEYRRRQKERRAHDAIEGNRYVRQLEVKLREAEQREAKWRDQFRQVENLDEVVKKLREAEGQAAMFQRRCAELNKENQRLKTANSEWSRERKRQRDAETLKVMRGFLRSSSSSGLPADKQAIMVKALGMLGSEHSGERDNAARTVERFAPGKRADLVGHFRCFVT